MRCRYCIPAATPYKMINFLENVKFFGFDLAFNGFGKAVGIKPDGIQIRGFELRILTQVRKSIQEFLSKRKSNFAHFLKLVEPKIKQS